MVEEIVNIVKEWLVDCSPDFLYRLGKDLTLDSDYNGLREKLKEFYDSR